MPQSTAQSAHLPSCTPVTSNPATVQLRERAAVHRAAKALAHEPDILARFTDDSERAGLIGESRNSRLLYLVGVSRHFDEPASALVTGPSSAGKSRAVKLVLSFFPPAAYLELSSVSPKALAYLDEPLSHRVLVMAEGAGFDSPFATYLVRTLLSDHRIRHVTVESTPDGLAPRTVEKDGPTGLIYTTTATSVHPENATRMLDLPMQDTAEQTRAVLRALADERQHDLDRRPWHKLDQLRQRQPREVTIPFAGALAVTIPDAATQHPRMRRDFNKVLTLIRAHALLHGATRPRDDQGRIVADLTDYAAVRELVSPIIGQAIGRTVDPEIRQTVEAVEAIHDETDDYVQVIAVAKRLGLHKSTASRRVSKTEEAGFLRNIEQRRGRPAQLVVADPMPRDEPVLPPPEAVMDADRCAGARLRRGRAK